MKRIVKPLILFVLIFLLVGCGTKENLEQSIGEKIFEDATGSEVDIEDDEIIFTDEEGQTVSLGSTEWPKSDLVKNIPEIKEGKIVTVLDSEEYAMIFMEKINKEFFEEYRDLIKESFTKESMESNYDEVVLYMASNGEGITIQLSYTMDSETLDITVGKSEQ